MGCTGAASFNGDSGISATSVRACKLIRRCCGGRELSIEVSLRGVKETDGNLSYEAGRGELHRVQADCGLFVSSLVDAPSLDMDVQAEVGPVAYRVARI